MDKYIYDEKNGLWYELQGDCYLPCLKLPEERTAYIGIWGQRHLRYLKQHRKGLYSELLISGKLNDYLADLNEQAEEMFSRLVKQLAEKEGVTEALKAEKPNAVGAENEQHPQRCYGNRCKRFDLRITSYRKGCCRRRRLFFFGKYSRSHKVP